MDILRHIPFSINQAIVFDIDDTLIDSHTDTILKKTFELYRYCITRGYKVYIITARAKTQNAIAYTKAQLVNTGIVGYKSIAFRPPNDYNVTKYKLDARRSIPENVIMSVGDQPWDIGQYGGVGVIVRNKRK